MPERTDVQAAAQPSAAPAGPASTVAQPAPGDTYAALEDVDFLDDIDFSLEDVESRIAPLALAHR